MISDSPFYFEIRLVLQDSSEIILTKVKDYSITIGNSRITFEVDFLVKYLTYAVGVRVLSERGKELFNNQLGSIGVVKTGERLKFEFHLTKGANHASQS